MKLEQRINQLRPDRTLANSFVMVCAVWMNLLVVVFQPVYASDQLGDIVIDGAAVPSALFEHFRRLEIKDYEVCPPGARKEKVIDRLIATMQNEVEAGLDPAIIEYLQTSASNLSDEQSIELAKEDMKTLNRAHSEYLRGRNLRLNTKDYHDEYQRRVRDKDPHITNLTIVRVLEIMKPKGVGWDDKLVELATSIKGGMSFEEAEAKYPAKFRSKNQTDNWRPLSTLEYNIDKNTVKVGDIFGLEKIISGEEYWNPMVKIYEVKTLSQVRLSDRIYRESRPDRDSDYLLHYLREKALERKTQEFMSELWANYTITEDGKPLQRVGIYAPCT